MQRVEGKRAGHGGQRRPATTTRSGSYQRSTVASSPDTKSALGGLLIYLLGRELPARERRTGWALAERWAVEMIDAKHGLIAGAA